MLLSFITIAEKSLEGGKWWRYPSLGI